MSQWEILGIEPTKDIKTIKSAYASMSKNYHPEEHPEEFQRLQNAYKAALDYAKGKSSAQVVVTPVEQSFSKQEPVKPEPEHVEVKVEIPETPYEEPPVLKMNFYDYDRIPSALHMDENPEKRFFRELNYMIWHPYMRQIPAYWDCFMNRSRYRDFMQEESFRELFLEKLHEKNFFFHREMRKYFAELWKDFEGKDLDYKLTKNSILSFKMSECETLEEKKEYDNIWDKARHGKGENAEDYLETYFKHAELNDEKLRDIYENANEARKEKSQARKYLIAVVVIILVRFFVR